MKLDNWSIVVVPSADDAYKAPEQYSHRLSGIVYGNPKFGEGCVVTTSRIVAYKDGVATTNSGSEYELGEVDPAYEVLYPNAKERLERAIT